MHAQLTVADAVKSYSDEILNRWNREIDTLLVYVRRLHYGPTDRHLFGVVFVRPVSFPPY